MARSDTLVLTHDFKLTITEKSYLSEMLVMLL
jgi:hypothetical protein